MTTDTTVTGATDPVTTLADDLLDLAFSVEPLEATLYGLPGYDNRLPDPSAAAEEDAVARLRALADRADDLAPAAHGDALVTVAVVAQQARAAADRLDARMVEYTICDIWEAPAAAMLVFLPMIALPDAERGRAYLDRLRALPGYLDAVTTRHRDGLAAGRVPVAPLVNSAIAQLDGYLADPGADPLLRPEPPADLPSFAADREALLADRVRPAFAAYREFLAREVAGRGRPDTRPGLCWLPGGDATYAALSRGHTTTDRSPEELHRVGIDLIARLAEEYATIGSRQFGTGNRAEVFARLREDPALHWRDGDELLAAARAAIARAQEAAPRWFGRLPSQDCRVEAVPAAEAAGAAAAYYMPPSLDGLRPGIYFANTLDADQRPRYTAEATAYHEAVPGHHFQLTLAQELTDLPLLRRLADVTAYSEGWGLYCERLADEMGLYSSDVDRLGMLALDSMRACRLVVDTGLHAMGWTRRQAIDYMTDNSPMAALEIASEVDRYIAAPGQALAYMVGRLEIERIRDDTRRRLGDRFDIRAFHDQVLGGGSLPLGVLAESVSRWAAAQA